MKNKFYFIKDRSAKGLIAYINGFNTNIIVYYDFYDTTMYYNSTNKNPFDILISSIQSELNKISKNHGITDVEILKELVKYLQLGTILI